VIAKVTGPLLLRVTWALL